MTENSPGSFGAMRRVSCLVIGALLLCACGERTPFLKAYVPLTGTTIRSYN